MIAANEGHFMKCKRKTIKIPQKSTPTFSTALNLDCL